MSDSDAASPAFDYERYRDFIAQIRLRDVWMASAKIENKVGPSTPDQVRVVVADRASWLAFDDGFHASVRYTIRFKVGSRTMSTVDVTFTVDYESDEPMSEELFSVFASKNLPLNTWPYLREFTANALGRMGWVPFTLPARKFNIDRP